MPDQEENAVKLREPAFNFAVDFDENMVSLTVEERTPDSICKLAELAEALQKAKIKVGIEKDAITKAFERLPVIEEAGEVIVIARGVKSVQGKNGWIDFKVNVSGRPVFQGADSDEEESDDAIDFKEAMQITMVEPNTVVAVLHPPTQGTAGKSLTGQELPTRPGKAAVLRAGEGVEADADESEFISTQAGRPVFGLGTISVSRTLEIPEDVDYETGNIKFNGHVVVHGNVLDEFMVEAKSVEVCGVVGASIIKCSGSLEIGKGVAGREKAEITVGGNFKAKYANQASLTVLGDLVVGRELVNSRVWCRGSVKAGKIIGGECLALGGISVAIAGSELGIHTVLEPGINFEGRRLDNQLLELEKEIAALLRPLEAFLGDRKRYKGFPEDKKTDIQNTFEKFLKLKAAYQATYSEKQDVLQSEEYTPVREAIVRKILYPDVFVRTDNCVRQFKVQQTGPITLLEDIDASTIRVRSGTGEVEDNEGVVG